MKITEEQYKQIQDSFPKHRGNVSIDTLTVLNAILYVLENGGKWRRLPKEFGNWHTIYTRMNRWAKSGALDRVFARLQREQMIRVRIEAVSLDSTYIKVHPDGTGALKKRASKHRPVKGRMDKQTSSGCRECYRGHSVFIDARQHRRCR